MVVKTKPVKVKQNQKVIDLVKINQAYMLYGSIVGKSLPYKFSYLDEWKLKEARLLLKEAKDLEYNLSSPPDKVIANRSKVYPRGTIIKVDFGVNLGSEMSQIHLAIVLNNYDNPRNNVLTVVPLTSQESKFNLDLGTLVINKLIEQINKCLDECKQKIINGTESRATIDKYSVLTKYYTTMIKTTHACCGLITTISKTRILYPINEYDIIGKARCSDEVLDIIEQEIRDKIMCKNI